MKATITPKKKDSITADDNIILEPDVTFELGKSISEINAEITDEERRIHETHECLVTTKPTIDEESDESDPEPAKRPTGRRRPSEEQLVAHTMQAIKASRKISRSQPHTRGSSKGAGITLEVPDESTDKLTTSSEGADEEQKDDYDERTTSEDEYVRYGAREDEYVYEDEYVRNDTDEEMKDGENVTTRKDDEVISDAAKSDAGKIEEVRDDNEQDGDELANVDQAKETDAQDNQATALVSVTPKEMPELPPTRSSVFVSSIFGNQFRNLSSDPFLVGTSKESADTKINSLLDIQIQQEVPQIQSPPLLKVHIMMTSKSYKKHPTHKELYDALIQSLFVDEDDMDKAAPTDPSTQLKRKHDDQDENPIAGSKQGKEKKRPRKDT
ncbi:hypothetical protein Tco_0810406 [Tanacetum coccineum]